MCESQIQRNRAAGSLWALCVAAVLGIALYGCAGGGTSGSDTAGRSVVVAGQVVNPGGAPRAGVEVTLLESGDSSSTDANGYYALESETDAMQATLEFMDDEFTAQVVVPDLPAEPIDITLDVEANVEEQTVTPQRVEVKTRPVTPTPTVRPAEPTRPAGPPVVTIVPVPTTHTAVPTEVPPTQIPERTQSPTPVVTPTRTIEPTPTPVPAVRWLLEGTLRDRSGHFVEGARVGVQETGASGITDQNGAFSFSTDVPGTSALLEVTVDGISGRVRIEGLPESTARIIVSLRITNPLTPPPATLTITAHVDSIQ